jgi:hypothetical protein
MPKTLKELLTYAEYLSADDLLTGFLSYVDSRKITLYPAQETAILELFDDKNVILNTPTGSGKSLVATALHFKALAQGKRSVYTCPIKALVNEKWMALCKEFGPERVGLCTGDASVNRTAPLLCCTAEILANIALREGERAAVDEVVMDEFHYYADRERGVAWQTPLLTLPQSRFLLMSATLGDTTFFKEELTRLNGRETVTVESAQRPVPLDYSYSSTRLPATLEKLVADKKSPVYVVHFTQMDAAQNAQNFTSLDLCTREEKAQLAQAIEGVHFNSPYGPDIRRWLKQGIGVHHAGLLPKYRILVEQLAQKGLLKIICGTDTLGVGINVPIRTVLLTRLCKYDGQKTAILSARDFHQITGRAGRKGFDECGWVVAQAPEYVIENLQLDAKKARDGKKVVKRKPPDKNFVNWDESTFQRLVTAQPERLVSRFQVSHGMLLNVLSRAGDGCAALWSLIKRCHDSPKQKSGHVNRAWQLFRSLVGRKIIEFIAPAPDGTKLRVNVELQDDFSMDQSLSLYLLETLPMVDKQALDYPLRVLTLAESIVENPEFILRKQLDKLKDAKMAEMKADGVEFDQRIEELDKMEYPKPDRDFIYSTFNDFSDRHPWVGQENIRPKSIVREMFESYASFGDYIRTYDLHRVEGLLLRHLNSVYGVLDQTVPDAAKTDEVREMELYLGDMIARIDSSILDEWNKMRDPSFVPAASKEIRPPGAEEFDADITRDVKKFTALIRTRLFAFLSALRKNDFEAAAAIFTEGNSAEPADSGTGPASETPAVENDWTLARLEAALAAFKSDHADIRLDPEARNLRHTFVKPSDDGKSWTVLQKIVDPEEHNDWAVEVVVDIGESKRRSAPVMQLKKFGEL